MDAEIFSQLFPLDYIKKFKDHNVRSDGRKFNQPRQVKYEYTSQILNYTYGNCYITYRYSYQLVDIKQSDISQLIKITIGYDQIEEQNFQERQRIENYYQSQLNNFIKNSVNYEDLIVDRQSNIHKAYQINYKIKISSPDGSLLAHLLNGLYFTIKKFKINHNDAILEIKVRDIKIHSLAIMDGIKFTDPNQLEEKVLSTQTIIEYLDTGKIQIIKIDGKPLIDI
ncbi:hypothetical protein pb186bvf_006883 [Paramecium bursaria]